MTPVAGGSGNQSVRIAPWMVSLCNRLTTTQRTGLAAALADRSLREIDESLARGAA